MGKSPCHLVQCRTEDYAWVLVADRAEVAMARTA